jgi:hypothetical protein
MANLLLSPNSYTLQAKKTHRTTVSLDAENYEFVLTYARANALKFNEAVIRMIQSVQHNMTPEAKRKPTIGMEQKGESWVFVLPKLPKGKKFPVITTEMVAQMDERTP